MPRARLRVCAQPGCPVIGAQTLCPEHRREREQARGTSAARGYSSPHQRLRTMWTPRVDTGNVRCSRCGETIRRGQPWDLGHHDGDRSRYRGPEHASCNRATAGRRSPGG